jgi:outer membrane protein TolC
LDCKVAQANFYPSLRLSARLGLNAFTPAFFAVLPESIVYSLVGDIVAPLINRNALKGQLVIANARQKQAVTRYEQTLLNAFIEVSNQWSRWNNLNKTYEYQLKQVDALTESISISSILFKSARADYMEVLLTQRDALESKFELIETRKEQYHAGILTYRALGGGWN